MKNLRTIFWITLLVTFGHAALAQTIYYVKPAGSGDGSSWANASGDLRAVILAAPVNAQVWVAGGTYKPSSTGDRDISFMMKSGVQVYGGFSGTETLLEERDITSNLTVLSGDLSGDDQPNGTGTGENSKTVVMADQVSDNSLLDGFTIQAGISGIDSPANDIEDPGLQGGGIFVRKSHFIVRNCILQNNFAFHGGGIYVVGSISGPNVPGFLEVSNTVFQSNRSSLGGAGLAINYNANADVISCKFIDNFENSGDCSDGGGGLAVLLGGGNTRIVNSLFWKNQGSCGGGVGLNATGGVDIINCTFHDNTASKGGALAKGSSAGVNILNSILWGNVASVDPAIHVVTGTPTVKNSIWQGVGQNLEGNFDVLSNPFAGAAGGDFSLLECFKTVDGGNDEYIPDGITTDLAGNPRIKNTRVDMGAVEYQPDITYFSGTIYVDQSATGANDGSSWANAFTDLQAALNSLCHSLYVEFWVAAGTYKPTTTTDRNISFRVPPAATLFGGFAGTESSISQRDIVNNETKLSGNIGDPGDIYDNSYHVLYIERGRDGGFIDGFTIADGFADFTGVDNTDNGGGIYIDATGDQTFITIQNTIIRDNEAANYGAGVYTEMKNGNIVFTRFVNVSFLRNGVASATYGGGAVFNGASQGLGEANVQFFRCTFKGNFANNYGGAIGSSAYDGAYTTISIDQCLFVGNVSMDGGAIDTGGALVDIWQSTFTGNEAATGAAVSVDSEDDSGAGEVTIRNSIIWNNEGSDDLYASHAGAGNISYTIIGDALPAEISNNGHVLNTDPLFSQAFSKGGNGFWGGGDDDYGNQQLTDCSPAINIGGAITGNSAIDLANQTRLKFGVLDLGPYENQNDITLSVSTLTPAHEAVNVAPGLNEVVLTLSRDVLLGTGEIEIKNVLDEAVVASWDVSDGTGITVSGGTITLALTAQLEKSNSYYISIPGTALRNCRSEFFSGTTASTWKFSTVQKDVVTVSVLNDITVPYGTDFASIVFPTEVEVTYDDASTQDLAVQFATGSYDGSTPGTYTIFGTLTLSSNTTNTQSRKAEVDVIVAAQASKDVVSVESLADISVAYATAFGSIVFPTEVEVTYDDASTENLDVLFTPGTYDGNTPGTYAVEGTLTLSPNTANPQNIKASVNVVVLPQGSKNITSVTNPANITVAYGTAFNSISFPSTVLVSYDDTSTENLAVIFSAGSYNGNAASTYTLEGTLTLTANTTNAANLKASVNVIVQKGDQTLTFNSLVDKIYGEADFGLVASATSGLPVSYSSSNTGVATISGSVVTITGAGTTTITAIQSGDANYNPAAGVDQILSVSKASQTISFGALPDKNFGDVDFTLTASSSSGLPVGYSSSDASVAAISGNTVTIIGAGTTIIKASQPGDSNYLAATDVEQTLQVNALPVAQAITFATLADRTLGDAAFLINASASSGLTVSFSTTSDKINLTGNQVTLVKAGRAGITASQAGNAGFLAASPVTQSFCIKPAKPVVSASQLNTEAPVLTSSSSTGNQWLLNGSIIAGSTGHTYTVSEEGTYSVRVTADDCQSEVSDAVPLVVTGDIRHQQAEMILYPNPVQNELYVSWPSDKGASLVVYQPDGKQLAQFTAAENRTSIDVRGYAKGQYLVLIRTIDRTYQGRFIKQ